MEVPAPRVLCQHTCGTSQGCHHLSLLSSKWHKVVWCCCHTFKPSSITQALTSAGAMECLPPLEPVTQLTLMSSTLLRRVQTTNTWQQPGKQSPETPPWPHPFLSPCWKVFHTQPSPTCFLMPQSRWQSSRIYFWGILPALSLLLQGAEISQEPLGIPLAKQNDQPELKHVHRSLILHYNNSKYS